MSDADLRTKPNADEVARRMLCLDMLQHRRNAEEVFLSAPTEDELSEQEDEVETMLSFLRSSGLWEFLSDEEVRAFETPLGQWKEDQYVDATWRVESLAVLAWALTMVKRLPGFDQQIDPEILEDVLDIDNWTEIVDKAQLRDTDEVERARDLSALWDWRSQVGTPPYEDPEDETEILEEAKAALEAGLVSTLAQGDLVALGRPYSALSEDELEELGSIALERHSALNWLCGYSDDWDNVPTDE
jgi:hypothetical protein